MTTKNGTTPADQVVSVLVLGTSRFSEDIGDLVHDTPGLRLAGFVENLDRQRCALRPLGLPVIWIDDLPSVVASHRFICGLGTTERHSYIAQADGLGARFATLRHPMAYLARTADVAEGAVIGPCAAIASQARIGAHSIVNRGASVGHHTSVGRGCTIGPGSQIAGRCTIGDRVYIGIGATVIDGVEIGNGAFITAGSLVIRDVPPGVKARGNPAVYSK